MNNQLTIKKEQLTMNREQGTMNNEKLNTRKEKNKHYWTKGINKGFLIMALFIAHCSFFITHLSALDFTLTPGGYVFIPMNESEDLYDMGGGGDFGFEADLSSIFTNPIGLGYTFGLEAAMLVNQLKSQQPTNISFYHAGANIGLYFFPLSRLLIRAEGALGVYMFAGERGTSDPGWYWRGGGKIGFRFTPGFTLAANAGWREFSSGGVTQNSGMYAGLTAQITFQTGRSNEGVNVTLDQYESVYPAFMQIYHNVPVGDVFIRNNENAEIRDVRLSFRAAGYTSSEFACGSVSIIPRGRSSNIPLFADFSNEILRFTDNGRIIGELVIRYKFLGQEREVIRAVTIATHNRNAVTENDLMALAAFISPTSPETLDFARFIAGLERANRRTGHNDSFSYAVWLLEGLRASRILINNELSTSPQGEVSRAQLAISNEQLGTEGSAMSNEGRVQFPSETLLFRSGTARDLAMLFAGCLEGVGIGSALISINNEQVRTDGSAINNEQLAINNEKKAESEFLVAVLLGVTAAQAETLFNGTERILIVDDNVWLPLSLSVIDQGFMACWNTGASFLNAAFASGDNVEFVIVQQAWENYPPAPLFELGRSGISTDNAAVLREVNNVFQRYITQEINPVIQRTQALANSATQQNRLGILFVRAGRINEGKAAYERAAGLGSVPAMTNRGNLALTERDFTTAERWFRQALQRDPNNQAALRGLERLAERR